MEATNEIVGFLNATVGTNYRASSKKTHQHIQARLREGYTPDDFRTVILRKNADWGNDPNMAKYLRPETLFGSKFESYLNQPDRGPPQSAHDVLTALYYEARGEEDHDP